MAKDKKKKLPSPVRTKHYIARASDPLGRDRILYRLSDDTEIGRIVLGTADKFSCADLTVTLTESPDADELQSLLENILTSMDDEGDTETVFVRTVPPDAAREPALSAALTQMEFSPDPADEAYLLYEIALSSVQTTYMCLGMSVGIAVGMCFGSSTGNTGIGMCFGIAIGMCLGIVYGTGVTKKNRAAREALREERMKAAKK